MKLGCLTAPFAASAFSVVRTLDWLAGKGIKTVELGTGNYPPGEHCNLGLLLSDSEDRHVFQQEFVDRGINISALSCHGNPIHPRKQTAAEHNQVMRDTISLANLLGVTTVNCFSGCAGDLENGTVPIWVTNVWPPEHENLLSRQWEESLIPYWREINSHADNCGVNVALEMHPNMMVYNTRTMLRLRMSAGTRIGCNFDPSHLWWQGTDPIKALWALKDCLFHVHAKDARLLPNAEVNGNLDTVSMGNLLERSWMFCTVGTGHGLEFWTELIAALRILGYDGALSIEHEDALMSTEEGLVKAIAFLQSLIIREPAGHTHWTK